MDTDGEPPAITPEAIKAWMPRFELSAIPEWLNIFANNDQDTEPDEWDKASWYRLHKCRRQHQIDAQSSTEDKIYAMPTLSDQVLGSLLQTTTISNPSDVSIQLGVPDRIASAMFAVLGAWTDQTAPQIITNFDDGVVAVHQLWHEVNQKHQGAFTHPLAPIIRQWLTETTAKHISKEYNRKHPASVLKHPVGNIREIAHTSSSWNDELGEVKGVSAPAPESRQIEIPGIEILDSVLPAMLPLQAIKMVDGMDTNKRGALAMPIRVFLEAVMALDPKETRADILIRLGDLLQFLNPDGKLNRTNHLPYVLKALHSLYYLRIPYRENPDKPSTEVDWIPVLARTVPNLGSGNDAPIILEVKLPPDARSGMMVEKDTLRLLGKQSAARCYAYLTACALFDRYGTVGKGIIDPTKPVERRNADGYLTTKSDDLIFDSKGKPITDPYHPSAIEQLDRIPNDARTHYPILSFNDLLRACFPHGHPNGQRAKYLKRALKAWEQLHTDGIIVIEKHQDGWRIMPSESHVGRYRALKQGTLESR